MNLKPVNIAVVDKNTIVKADVLRSEKIGSAVKLKPSRMQNTFLLKGKTALRQKTLP